MLNQEKAAARRAILEQQKLQPLFKLQSEFYKRRYPEMFGDQANPPKADGKLPPLSDPRYNK